jgi:hypothetical protein
MKYIEVYRELYNIINLFVSVEDVLSLGFIVETLYETSACSACASDVLSLLLGPLLEALRLRPLESD